MTVAAMNATMSVTEFGRWEAWYAVNAQREQLAAEKGQHG